MKRRISFSFLLGCMMLTLGTGCSSSDDDATAVLDDGRKPRQLTLIQDTGSRGGDELTRTLLTEENNALTAKWQVGDKLTYCNVSALQYNTLYSGTTLTAESQELTSNFNGEVICGKGDYLAVVYPQTTFNIIEGDESAYYTILLSGQNGVLSNLATTYHHIYGDAKVTSVTNNAATATIKMKNHLAVCKFGFKLSADGSLIPIQIQSLQIGYTSTVTTGLLTGSYPQSATVTVKLGNPITWSVVPASSEVPLTITTTGNPTEVYVAMLPSTNSINYTFTVKDTGGNTYVGVASATLVAGTFVNASGLIVTKQ